MDILDELIRAAIRSSKKEKSEGVINSLKLKVTEEFDDSEPQSIAVIKDGHEYQIPDSRDMEPGDVLTLHMDQGVNTDTDLFWGQNAPAVEEGDQVVFIDQEGCIQGVIEIT